MMQINYHAYMNSSGYSISAQDYILAMLRVKPDVDIKIHLINQKMNEGISRNRKQLFTALQKKESIEPSLNLYHSIPVRYRRPPGKTKHFGFCVFETISPPKDWINVMNNMDAIITASHFNQNVFENSGVKVPIHVIPHCFDSEIFHRDVTCPGRYNKTTFISIGTWKKRKNWEMLIKGWYEAFESRHNVCLLIKTDKPRELRATVEHVKRTADWRAKTTAPIYCEENPVCDFEDIPSVLRKGDIYISASLGEGFGISGLHAMALGIPVITTRFSGCLEYAKPDLCTYLEPKKYQSIPVMDVIPQLSNCIWPYISVNELAKKMRSVLQNVKEREEKTQKAYKYVHDNFSYEVIGKKFLDTLEIK
ncbi:MAG: glycosyltransferase family 4 protein [Promethearchaeota archaeon]|jgi:glycosyltransferase involved in cell wall biosynthesis